MSMLNGEGYGRSDEERFDNAVDEAFPGKPGFGSVYQVERDRVRTAFYGDDD